MYGVIFILHFTQIVTFAETGRFGLHGAPTMITLNDQCAAAPLIGCDF